MSDITVIGLGLMGAALARAIQRAGHDLTVWNRSPDKMGPFKEDGVACAPDLGSALAASPVILICIDNYAVTEAMLGTDEAAPLLAGRAMVQLSTGTPNEARVAATWMAARGVDYLDGGILGGPAMIGTDQVKILLSGSKAANERAGALLDCLGDGTVRYLGDDAGAAAALDLAWLYVWYGRFIATINAANLLRSEAASLEEFIGLFDNDPKIQYCARVIHEEAYENPTGTLQVWSAALEVIRQQGRRRRHQHGLRRPARRHLQEGARRGPRRSKRDGPGQGARGRGRAAAWLGLTTTSSRPFVPATSSLSPTS